MSPDFTDKYNTFLTPEEQVKFQAWRKSLPENLRNSADYDLQGAWKAQLNPSANAHLPDDFKKPNHPTFSDQSVYHGKDGFQGGKWGEGDSFTASPTNLQMHGTEGLKSYFNRVEPNSKLTLPQEKPAMAPADGDVNGLVDYGQRPPAGTGLLTQDYDPSSMNKLGPDMPQPLGGGSAPAQPAPARPGSRIDSATSQRARLVYDGLVKRGLDPSTALGFAANAVQESGALMPGLGAGDGGSSHRTFMWRGDRWKGYQDMHGTDPSKYSLDTDLDYLMHELQGPEAHAQAKIAAASSGEKAGAISQWFERPKETENEIALRTRHAQDLAQSWGTPELLQGGSGPQGSGQPTQLASASASPAGAGSMAPTGKPDQSDPTNLLSGLSSSAAPPPANPQIALQMLRMLLPQTHTFQPVDYNPYAAGMPGSRQT